MTKEITYGNRNHPGVLRQAIIDAESDPVLYKKLNDMMVDTHNGNKAYVTPLPNIGDTTDLDSTGTLLKMGGVMFLKPSEIIDGLDNIGRPSNKLDEVVVKMIADDIKREEAIDLSRPFIIVLKTPGGYFLLDGKHRLTAFCIMEDLLYKIPVVVAELQGGLGIGSVTTFCTMMNKDDEETKNRAFKNRGIDDIANAALSILDERDKISGNVSTRTISDINSVLKNSVFGEKGFALTEAKRKNVREYLIKNLGIPNQFFHRRKKDDDMFKAEVKRRMRLSPVKFDEDREVIIQHIKQKDYSRTMFWNDTHGARLLDYAKNGIKAPYIVFRIDEEVALNGDVLEVVENSKYEVDKWIKTFSKNALQYHDLNDSINRIPALPGIIIPQDTEWMKQNPDGLVLHSNNFVTFTNTEAIVSNSVTAQYINMKEK
jgi:hypothetical protein